MDENRHHIKSAYFAKKVSSADDGKKHTNRVRFAKPSALASLATADVYRKYDRHLISSNNVGEKNKKRARDGIRADDDRGDGSHDLSSGGDNNKRRLKIKTGIVKPGDGRVGLIDGDKYVAKDSKEEENIIMTGTTILSSELDSILDRNGSERFRMLYDNLYSMVRSKPELLHHLPKVVEMLLSCAVGDDYICDGDDDDDEVHDKINEDDSNTKIDEITSVKENKTSTKDEEVEDEEMDDENEYSNKNDASSPQLPLTLPSSSLHSNHHKKPQKKQQQHYRPNPATIDALSLLSTLAREVRHEVTPYVIGSILPRIVGDIIAPSCGGSGAKGNGDSDDNAHGNKKNRKKKGQNQRLDVDIVEAAFRTIADLLRYGGLPRINKKKHGKDGDKCHDKSNNIESSSNKTGDINVLRPFYSQTLGHRHELIRRLASEAFAPSLRSCRDRKVRNAHLRSVLKSLSFSVVRMGRVSITSGGGGSAAMKRTRDDAVDGVSRLLYRVARGGGGGSTMVPGGGRLHRSTSDVIGVTLNCLMEVVVGNKVKKEGNIDIGNLTKEEESKNIEEIKEAENRCHALYDVTSSLLLRLRDHVANAPKKTRDRSMPKHYYGAGKTSWNLAAVETFGVIWEEIHRCLTKSISDVVNYFVEKNTLNDSCRKSRHHSCFIAMMMMRCTECLLQTGDILLLRDGTDKRDDVRRICNTLRPILEVATSSITKAKSKLEVEQIEDDWSIIQTATLQLYGAVWSARPDHQTPISFLPQILVSFAEKESKVQQEFSNIRNNMTRIMQSHEESENNAIISSKSGKKYRNNNPATFLAEKVLPHLPQGAGRGVLVSTLLAEVIKAGSALNSHPSDSACLLYTVISSCSTNNQCDDKNDEDGNHRIAMGQSPSVLFPVTLVDEIKTLVDAANDGCEGELTDIDPIALVDVIIPVCRDQDECKKQKNNTMNGKKTKNINSDGRNVNIHHSKFFCEETFFVASCLPFLASLVSTLTRNTSKREGEDCTLNCDGDEGEYDNVVDADVTSVNTIALDRIHSWCLRTLEELQDQNFNSTIDHDHFCHRDISDTSAFVLESLIRSAPIPMDKLMKGGKHASRLLSERPASVIVGRAASVTFSFLHARNIAVPEPDPIIPKRLIKDKESTYEETEMYGRWNEDNCNETADNLSGKEKDGWFNILKSNLRSRNHFLRLYSLEILSSLPVLHYVVDHDGFDPTENLDNEHNGIVTKGSTNSFATMCSSSITGRCDVVNLLLRAESLPPSLKHERGIRSALGRVAVAAGTGRLPVEYAEVALCHSLGMMNIPFQPVWDAASTLAVSILSSSNAAGSTGGGATWISMLEGLQAINSPLSFQQEQTLAPTLKVIPMMMPRSLLATEDCIVKGNNSSDGPNAGQPQDRDRFTDADTVHELWWGILRKVPGLTAHRSRDTVPLFLRFLRQTYYVFHDDDPDGWEFQANYRVSNSNDNEGKVDKVNYCFESNNGSKGNESKIDGSQKRDLFATGPRGIRQRLITYLSVFADVNGMTQLHNHCFLLNIFTSFLSNTDTMVSRKALRCVTNYNLLHLSSLPLSLGTSRAAGAGELLEKMLDPRSMRDALISFRAVIPGDEEHRRSLMPIVVRVLFGRLVARQGGNKKSSKDTPAARRAAVLSFLGGLGKSHDDHNFLIYMMVRQFVLPPEETTKQEVRDDKKKDIVKETLQAASKIVSIDVSRVDGRRIVGFLNLVMDMVRVIGFGIGTSEKVHMLGFMLLAIMEYAEGLRSSSISCISRNDKNLSHDDGVDEDEDEGEDEEEDFSEDVRGRPAIRGGILRNLCFRTMCHFLVQFSSMTDFLPLSGRLQSAISLSVSGLPGAVIGAERQPGILILLLGLSSCPGLIPLLGINEVSAVFRSISRAKRNVMDSCLRFIENLLNGGLERSFETRKDPIKPGPGSELVKTHLHLLLGQFAKRLRLQGKGDPKELGILCRVSELLIVDDDIVGSDTGIEDVDDNPVTMMEELCTLLLPFLTNKRNGSINENVLRILSSLIPKISGRAAWSHLHIISRLLGPNSSGPGIIELEMRQRIVAVIEAIAVHNCALKTFANIATQLCASHPKRVDEPDFDIVLPALLRLTGDTTTEGGWFHSYEKRSNDSGVDGIKAIAPISYICLHMLHDSDGVVSRGSFNALKSLILAASKVEDNDNSGIAARWSRFVETSIMPCLHLGLRGDNIAARRVHVQLIATIAQAFSLSKQSPGLHGDLFVLANEDNTDLDFFLNITHVQLHRRGRALTRIRNKLTCIGGDFSVSSLADVLLPLCLHPVYECSQNGAEEVYVMEAIATLGAIARWLPWGKYRSALWRLLAHLPNKEGHQERFLVAAICTMIDNFHFKVSLNENENEKSTKVLCFNSEGQKNSLGETLLQWKNLEKGLIPKVETYLVKKKVVGGMTIKSLRSPMVLALLSLFQKLPREIFEVKLSHLLTVLCNSLRNKESNERDAARRTLAKMATSIDLKYLSDILQELTVTLKEGYQLHVRAATVHSILLSLSDSYERPPCSSPEDAMSLSFDNCVPAMMDIIQQDIFGRASEMKEAENVQKRVIKEAVGVKSFSSLQIISSLIIFRPSLAISQGKKSAIFLTAVHALVSPFLERLRDPEVDKSTIGKVNECMNRIVVGLSNNSSVVFEELLPFVYATVSPFLISDEKLADSDSDSNDSDDENLPKIEVSKTNSKKIQDYKSTEQILTRKMQLSNPVYEWNPSSLKNPTDSKKAHEIQTNEKLQQTRVQGGENALTLTVSRHTRMKSSSKGLNDPVQVSAVTFGLSLLHSFLKRSKIQGQEMMADPFVRILTECVRYSSDNNIILLSMKSLHFLLQLNLPSIPEYKKQLGKYTLRLLITTGASNFKHEITQSCFKMLTLLIKTVEKNTTLLNLEAGSTSFNDDSQMKLYNKNIREGKVTLPLTQSQMQVLVSILQAALIEAEHHNSTFSLIKAITSRNYISPEYYDLIDTILKLSVQSHKTNVRQKACQIFMHYLVEYPMGKQRMENHLKQMILNMKYEYEEGRVSAMGLCGAVIQKLPLPLLEENTQLLFLPLVLQLANDESKVCREKITECISFLLKRLSTKLLLSLYEYAVRWLAGKDKQLSQISVQIFGFYVDNRLDFMKRGNRLEELTNCLHLCLVNEIGSIENTSILLGKEWEMSYFCLLCIEKLNNQSSNIISKKTELWVELIKFLVHPHPWIKQTSSRIIWSYISELDAHTLVQTFSGEKKSFLVEVPGPLFQIARNLCRQLGDDEEKQVEAISTLAIRSLTWVIKAMHSHPALCFNEEYKKECDPKKDLDDNDEKVTTTTLSNPVAWLMTRLSHIAKLQGVKRRETIFKCFAAFASSCDAHILSPHLELILQPLNRVLTETKSQHDHNLKRVNNTSIESEPIISLTKDVLDILEEKCGTELFLNAYSIVKTKAKQKRDFRKQAIAVENVHDPQAAAKRRIFKQQKEKNRRKRRVEERKSSRGVFGKKFRHTDH